jgi:hypothetical protein
MCRRVVAPLFYVVTHPSPLSCWLLISTIYRKKVASDWNIPSLSVWLILVAFDTGCYVFRWQKRTVPKSSALFRKPTDSIFYLLSSSNLYHCSTSCCLHSAHWSPSSFTAISLHDLQVNGMQV